MSHHIYHTDGLILQSAPFAETNLIMSVLTRDLGLVQATAQGVRTMNSKLRFALHDLSVAKMSFVRGKGMWKVTSAIPEKNVYAELKNHKTKLVVLAQVLKAVRRLVAGEEENSQLFGLLEDYYKFLTSNDLTDELVKLSEYVILLRVLHNLGYVNQNEISQQFIGGDAWTNDLVSALKPLRRKVAEIINRSLRESQL